MPFVHSLVRAAIEGKLGWCAPAEFGEAAPHYISFVIPVDRRGQPFPGYSCETVSTVGDEKRVALHQLVREGEDSFVLRLGTRDLWFTIKPGSGEERRLAYVGELGHQDFSFHLTEIEPAEPDLLDSLFEEEDTYVIGCEPFTHYAGIERLVKK